MPPLEDLEDPLVAGLQYIYINIYILGAQKNMNQIF